MKRLVVLFLSSLIVFTLTSCGNENSNNANKNELYLKAIAILDELGEDQRVQDFSYAGQDTENVEIAVNDGKPIENKLIYGSVSGKKITENGEELGGAVIGLFKADETEFTKENALMTATSENDGSLESTGVFKSAVARKCNSFKYY